MKTDTIAAIATGMTNSGIGIIRISGPESIKIADKIFQAGNKNLKLAEAQSHTIHYGFICDEENIIDEVMVSVMRGPRSFTSEDTVEINCHGGILVMRRILELTVKKGCRLAEPGEFTKRAFLNGRIDLSEAEAVMDVISSENEMALKSSVSQLRGIVSDEIRQLREKILFEIAFIESALDDPEHISLDGYQERLSVKIKDLKKELEKLISSAENGRRIKEGIHTVIIGKPNVGKSSLLNLLSGNEKAIVTDIAGTTRDALEENINLNGISLHVIDTAGIRSTNDTIEKIGVEKAKKYADDADLLIYMVDSSIPLDKNDIDVIQLTQNKNCIVVLNKSDLDAVVTEKEIWKAFYEAGISMEKVYIIKASVKEGTGIAEFEDTIKELFFAGSLDLNHEIMITNVRHKENLVNALESLKQVTMSVENSMPEDFYSIDLMSAYSSLGFIIGEEVGDDLIQEIFSKFCMGK